jgi:L-asparaginase/Glu-tRNA(Gln) amidotransferase subunit D
MRCVAVGRGVHSVLIERWPCPVSMATSQSVSSNHALNNPEPKHLFNYHRTPSASEIFLRTFRSGFGTPSVPVSRSKEGESRVLVLYTGGTIGMMKNDKKGMMKSVIPLVP